MVTPTTLIAAAAVSTPGAGTLYTVPANQTCVLKKLTFSNSTNGALTVSVYLVPSGGSAGDSNVIKKLRTVGPYEAWEVFEAENHNLNAGDFISAAASGAGIVARGSGLLVV